MDLHTLAFVFGALLLLIGLLGGGFEVKELKLPKVGWSIRLISITVGMFFLAIGLNVIEIPRIATDTHSSVATEISELERKVQDIDIQIQALEEQAAGDRGPFDPQHKLQDARREHERRLAEIESRQMALRSELEQLRPFENADAEAKRRIEQIEGEEIPSLEAEKRAVQTELEEMHGMAGDAEKPDVFGGRIGELEQQKQSLQEAIDRLTRQNQ